MNVMMIKGIRSFNDIYINCYYSSLIPVLIAFDKNIFSFLINDFLCLECDIKNKKMGISNHYVVPEKILFEEQGLKLQKDFINENYILEEIEKSIKDNKPIIVLVDSFFQKYNYNTYQKKHFLHYLLVAGFDNKEKKIWINEHEYWESEQYKIMDMDYDAFLDIYNGAKIYKKKEEFLHLQIIREQDFKLKDNFIYERYNTFIQMKKEHILENLYLLKENLECYCNDFQEVSYIMDKYRKYKNAVFYTYNFINKRREEPIKENLNMLNKIWSLSVKASITKEISERLKKAIFKELFDFMEKEICFYEKFTDK